MKVSEAKSSFFKIGPQFASNAFVSFKNAPKQFQISFLGHRNAKVIILKSKVKKHFWSKIQDGRLDFTTMLRQKFLRNFAKTASGRWVEPFRKSSGSRIVFIELPYVTIPNIMTIRQLEMILEHKVVTPYQRITFRKRHLYFQCVKKACPNV